jgi:Zn-dependent peptidase ImmA (M78 family)
METLSLSTDVLEWAAAKIGRSLDSLAVELTSRPKNQVAIVQGQLTSSQAAKFAKKTNTPFGFLFLSEPPEIAAPLLPDLRQTPSPEPLSQDFQDVLNDVLQKQEWFRGYLKQHGVRGPDFVGKFKTWGASKVDDVATFVTELLRLTPSDRRSARQPDDMFRLLAERIEELGVLVIKSGYVGSYTQRTLSYREFRGFAVSDELVPIIFVNGKDHEVAFVFTLIHEFVHILLGESGVSDLGSSAEGKPIEVFCNAVAAAVLVPQHEFISEYKKDQDLGRIAKHFRVSKLVSARRALELSLIPQSEYLRIARESANSKPASKQEGGGNPYATARSRNSKRLTRALLDSVMSEKTLVREAAQLLNASPSFTVKLMHKQSANEQ